MQAKQTRSDILYMTTLDTGRCSHVYFAFVCVLFLHFVCIFCFFCVLLSRVFALCGCFCFWNKPTTCAAAVRRRKERATDTKKMGEQRKEPAITTKIKCKINEKTMQRQKQTKCKKHMQHLLGCLHFQPSQSLSKPRAPRR